jgi:hypothetical protein
MSQSLDKRSVIEYTSINASRLPKNTLKTLLFVPQDFTQKYIKGNNHSPQKQFQAYPLGNARHRQTITEVFMHSSSTTVLQRNQSENIISLSFLNDWTTISKNIT